MISRNQVKNLRGRYESAGNKDDRLDAFVLADTLRTDRARLTPLSPDSPATVILRRACRARKDLVAHRDRDRQPTPRAPARHTFPGAVGLSPRSATAEPRSVPPEHWHAWPASTRQSGKLRSVAFRWACDKQLRDAVTDFAADNPPRQALGSRPQPTRPRPRTRPPPRRPHPRPRLAVRHLALPANNTT
ncbi:transposase [Kribbella sp. VKM Ac-2571]|uniref:IS110 family transposase n=1 Tax=Kribbella sp. VKM Ac-2571 TaxID=2512222 RepID=UPI001EE0A187|nr:transposase [Kribbella sp. VKM Ac-2571]